MADMDSSPGSNTENPGQDSTVDPIFKFKNTIDSIVQQFHDSNLYDQQRKFWESQPVVQFKDVGNSSLPEGPIEQPTPLSEVKQEPHDLPNLFEWTVCDMDSDEVCNEVYILLTNHHVETFDGWSRVNYSKEFLRWGLRPPRYIRSWHIGIRVKGSKKLVAFITGIPVKMRVRDDVVQTAEVNFLCVHKKLRSKRLAPVLIKEIARRISLENIWQAAYTAAVLLPTPITTSQCWHRPLNPKKLIDVGFYWLGEGMTMSGEIKRYKLPSSTATPGLRKMELRDVPLVTHLLRNYLSKFVVTPTFDEDEVEHWLLPRENVVESCVVESPDTHEITDFFSFYTLPWSILNDPNYSTLKEAYAFYNVSTQTPLPQLIHDALIIAKQKHFDVFNALDVMENMSFLRKLKFCRGDGKLKYYLYNYRLRDALKPSELGLVMF